jgi:hypothetical protein
VSGPGRRPRCPRGRAQPRRAHRLVRSQANPRFNERCIGQPGDVSSHGRLCGHATDSSRYTPAGTFHPRSSRWKHPSRLIASDDPGRPVRDYSSINSSWWPAPGLIRSRWPFPAGAAKLRTSRDDRCVGQHLARWVIDCSGSSVTAYLAWSRLEISLLRQQVTQDLCDDANAQAVDPCVQASPDALAALLLK